MCPSVCPRLRRNRTDVYSPVELDLFQQYTRETYSAAFGVDAPAWDPTRLLKSWFDSTVFTPQPATVTYQVFGQDTTGAWGFQNLTLALADAASVNLPGAITYPQYVVQPTDATRGTSGMSANYLSLESDANALLPTFGGTSLVDQGITPVFPVNYPADEPRRMWAIVMPNGNQLNVGLLLLERNANGIGSPATGTHPPTRPLADIRCGSRTRLRLPDWIIPAPIVPCRCAPSCRTNASACRPWASWQLR